MQLFTRVSPNPDSLSFPLSFFFFQPPCRALYCTTPRSRYPEEGSLYNLPYRERGKVVSYINPDSGYYPSLVFLFSLQFTSYFLNQIMAPATRARVSARYYRLKRAATIIEPASEQRQQPRDAALYILNLNHMSEAGTSSMSLKLPPVDELK